MHCDSLSKVALDKTCLIIKNKIIHPLKGVDDGLMTHVVCTRVNLFVRYCGQKLLLFQQ